MPKRGAEEQGRRETGLDSFRDPDFEPRENASADVLARRKIKVPKSNKRLGQGRGIEALGNIFASASPSSLTSPAPQTNAFNAINPNVLNNPSQNTSVDAQKFHSPFASTSSRDSQPLTGGNIFGSNGASGFAFSSGGTGSNPFSQVLPSQAQNNLSLFNTPPLNTPFKGFSDQHNPTAQDNSALTPTPAISSGQSSFSSGDNLFGAIKQPSAVLSSHQTTLLSASNQAEAPATPSTTSLNAAVQQEPARGNSIMPPSLGEATALLPSHSLPAAHNSSHGAAKTSAFTSGAKETPNLFTQQSSGLATQKHNPATNLFEPNSSANMFAPSQSGTPKSTTSGPNIASNPFASHPATAFESSPPKPLSSGNIFAPRQDSASQSTTPSLFGTSNPFANILGNRGTSSSTAKGAESSMPSLAELREQPTSTGAPFTPQAAHQWISKTPQPAAAAPASPALFQPATAPPKSVMHKDAIKPTPQLQDLATPTALGKPDAVASGQHAAKDAQGAAPSQAAANSLRTVSQSGSESGEGLNQRKLDQFMSFYNLSESQAALFKDHIKLRSLNRCFIDIAKGLHDRSEIATFAQAYVSEYSKLIHLLSSENTNLHKRKADTPATLPLAKVARTSEAPITPVVSSVSGSKPQSQTASMFQSIVDEQSPSPSLAPTRVSPPSVLQFQPSKPLFDSSTPQPAKSLFGISTPQPGPGAVFGNAWNGAPNTVPSKTGQTTATGSTSLFSGNSTQGFTASPFGSSASGNVGSVAPLFGRGPWDNPGKANSVPAASSAGAEPDLAAPATVPTPQDSSPSGFQVPSFGVSASGQTNFAAQFGQQAKKTADEAKARRKADDFDSDEDDEAEWERRDAENQRRKAEELEQHAKKKMKHVPGQGFELEEDGSGFPEHVADRPLSFHKSANTSNSAPAPVNIFGHVGQPSEQEGEDGNGDSNSDDESAQSAPNQPASQPSSGLSLFDRISVPAKTNGHGNSDGSREQPFGLDDHADEESVPSNPTESRPTASVSGGSLFGNLAAGPESKASGVNTSPGDHTWKGDSDSPIKFGARNAAVNGSATKEAWPFAPLSNAAKPLDSTPSLFGNLTPATPLKQADQPGSLFGTKPGASSSSAALLPASRGTTPGTTSNGTSAAPSDDEESALDAQSDLTALSSEERLTEQELFAVKVKLMQFHKDDKANPFKTIGTGPLRILKNKRSGSVRMLCRCVPRGQVILNASLQKGMLFSKKQKSVVQFGAPDTAGTFQTWYAKTGQDDKANDMVKTLVEWTPSA